MTTEEMKIKERELYAEYQALEGPLNAKRDEWNIVYTALKRIELREQIRAEIIANEKAAVSPPEFVAIIPPAETMQSAADTIIQPSEQTR